MDYEFSCGDTRRITGIDVLSPLIEKEYQKMYDARVEKCSIMAKTATVVIFLAPIWEDSITWAAAGLDNILLSIHCNNPDLQFHDKVWCHHGVESLSIVSDVENVKVCISDYVTITCDRIRVTRQDGVKWKGAWYD